MRLRERLKRFVRGTGLNIDDAGVFCRTQWRLPWVAWLIYRLLIPVYYITFQFALMVYALVTLPSLAAYTWVYVTQWTFILLIIYLVIAFVNVVLDRRHGRHYHVGIVEGGGNRPPTIVLSWRHTLQWMLLSIVANISILITVIYWSFIRVPLPLIYDLTAHTFPAIIGIIDVVMTPIPVRLQHVVYPLSYSGIYMLFTLVYWAVGGTDVDGNTGIYPGLLDYEEPATAGVNIVYCTVAIVFCQLIIWGMYKGKMAIVKCTATDSSVDGAVSTYQDCPTEKNQEDLDTLQHNDEAV